MPKTNAERIREFHETLGVGAPDIPTLPQPQTLALRETLLDEEFREVKGAFAALLAGQTADIAPLIHELTDLLYVTYGAILACGVDADAVFAEVHAANMRKLGGPRRPDGKVLKPPDWEPANVAAVIAQQRAAARPKKQS